MRISLRSLLCIFTTRFTTATEFQDVRNVKNDIEENFQHLRKYLTYNKPSAARSIPFANYASSILTQNSPSVTERAESRLSEILTKMKSYINKGKFDYELFIIVKGGIGSDLFKVRYLMDDTVSATYLQAQFDYVQQMYVALSMAAKQISRWNEEGILDFENID